MCHTVSGFLAREVEVRAQRVDVVQNQGGKARMVISDVPAAVE